MNHRTKLHIIPLILLYLSALHPASSHRRFPNSNNNYYFILPPLPSPPSSFPSPSPSEPPIGQEQLAPFYVPSEMPKSTVMSLDERPSLFRGFLPGSSGSSAGACKESTYPGICASAVKQFFTSGFTDSLDDKSTILDLMMKAGKKKTEEALAEFNRIADSQGSADVRNTLEGCKQDYSDALDSYEAAMRALKVKDMPTVKINLDAVLQGYYGCGDGDAPGDPVPSVSGPWIGFNEELRKLTDNCFDLVETLHT